MNGAGEVGNIDANPARPISIRANTVYQRFVSLPSLGWLPLHKVAPSNSFHFLVYSSATTKIPGQFVRMRHGPNRALPMLSRAHKSHSASPPGLVDLYYVAPSNFLCFSAYSPCSYKVPGQFVGVRLDSGGDDGVAGCLVAVSMEPTSVRQSGGKIQVLVTEEATFRLKGRAVRLAGVHGYRSRPKYKDILYITI